MIERGRNLRQGIFLEVDKEKFGVNLSIKEKAALDLAAEIHKGDVRKITGEPYVNHCIAVAMILKQWKADEDMIVAGLLHDTWEDHPDLISLEQIKGVFGERVAHLVDGVSKFVSSTGKESDFETLRKITTETLVDPGVAMIKLADRLHNMTTMKDFGEDKKLEKAKETLDVYVPLAESLGLWQVKNILADIAFSYVDSEKYNDVKRKIDGDPRLNENFIQKTEGDIRAVLKSEGIEALVEHQIGGYWELSEKQKKSAMRSDSRPKEFADITDVVSFRVIIEDEANVGECYRAMGMVRTRYSKLLQQSRSDDYLATPAINGYSALHDTYKLNEGNIEVAFTTLEREQFNNWGVASLSAEELRTDADKYKRKLIFTPKKELAVMELSATGIDVAFRLNPLLGLRAVAIKIDGKVESLEAVVPNASVVEIITEQHQTKPNAEWLKFCNKETASQIDSQLKIAEHDVEVEKGEKMLVDGVLRERGVLNIEDLDEDIVDKLLVDLGCWYGIDDLYYKVAYGLDLSLVSRKLDEMKVGRGMFTTVLIEGPNSIGVSEQVAGIISRNGGDVRSKVEKVDKEERFTIRMLLAVDYRGKKKIEEEMKMRFSSCEVI